MVKHEAERSKALCIQVVIVLSIMKVYRVCNKDNYVGYTKHK